MKHHLRLNIGLQLEFFFFFRKTSWQGSMIFSIHQHFLGGMCNVRHAVLDNFIANKLDINGTIPHDNCWKLWTKKSLVKEHHWTKEDKLKWICILVILKKVIPKCFNSIWFTWNGDCNAQNQPYFFYGQDFTKKVFSRLELIINLTCTSNSMTYSSLLKFAFLEHLKVTRHSLSSPVTLLFGVLLITCHLTFKN